MMQPRNRTVEVVEVGEGWWRLLRGAPPPTSTVLHRPSPSLGFVAASIPIANPNLFHPASHAGTPVLRSARTSAYTNREIAGVVRAHSASLARTGAPRCVVMTSRAASSPRPYPTPDGH